MAMHLFPVICRKLLSGDGLGRGGEGRAVWGGGEGRAVRGGGEGRAVRGGGEGREVRGGGEGREVRGGGAGKERERDLVDQRAGVYDGDEFDVFRRKDVNLSQVHIGKR